MTSDVLTGNNYDKYASSNPIERKLMGGFFDALTASLPEQAPETILEVGVGEGEVSARLRELYPDARSSAATCPTTSSRPTGGQGAQRHVRRHRAAAVPRQDLRPGHGHRGARARVRPAGRPGRAGPPARSRLVLSVPREPVWRVANMARGKYIGALGNTPGHVNHWSKRSFASLVATQFDVVDVRSPFPWTMVAARSRT